MSCYAGYPSSVWDFICVEQDMKTFENGWPGLRKYAVEAGVATVDDGDDAVAAKIRAVLEGTAPEVADESGDEADAA